MKMFFLRSMMRRASVLSSAMSPCEGGQEEWGERMTTKVREERGGGESIHGGEESEDEEEQIPSPAKVTKIAEKWQVEGETGLLTVWNQPSLLRTSAVSPGCL